MVLKQKRFPNELFCRNKKIFAFEKSLLIISLYIEFDILINLYLLSDEEGLNFNNRLF